MISKGKHQKHPPLVRSSIGHYHRCEWAIYGTGCNQIQTFFNKLDADLNDSLLSYIDADHSTGGFGLSYQNGKKQIHKSTKEEHSHFDDRLSCLASEAVFVNGNHYPANRQIIIIDSNKKDSLKRREDQLTSIDIVIVDNDRSEIFDFVIDKMDSDTKVLKKDQWSEVVNHVKVNIERTIAPIKALILAGGKSQRMGVDKSSLIYNENQTQEEHLKSTLDDLGLNAYVSKRYQESPEVNDSKCIIDKMPNMGPFGAIISAMMTDPNSAWLVIACDLPYLGKSHLETLLQGRDSSRLATAFRGSENPFPEPLITIYEPRAYQRFLSFLSLGYACPRKVLINSDIKEILLEDMTAITNVNTPEERDQAIKDLNR